MATNPARRQHVSFEQYLLLLNDSDRRYEYHDGEVRLMAGGSSDHAAISLNLAVILDQALGDDAICRPYVADKLVRVTPTRTVMPDVLVSCTMTDHGQTQIVEHPVFVVEVPSRTTEMTDRFEKLALYQAKESIQEILFISQIIQRVELFSRTATGWLYQQYNAGQSFHLACLDLEIPVQRLYRRLTIPSTLEPPEVL